jgi:hypothetical protein
MAGPKTDLPYASWIGIEYINEMSGTSSPGLRKLCFSLFAFGGGEEDIV